MFKVPTYQYIYLINCRQGNVNTVNPTSFTNNFFSNIRVSQIYGFWSYFNKLLLLWWQSFQKVLYFIWCFH